jgi:predicted AAA+ superfamily ATPase
MTKLLNASYNCRINAVTQHEIVMSDADTFFIKANRLLGILEGFFGTTTEITFDTDDAYCWQYSPQSRRLIAVHTPVGTRLDDLQCIESQKDALITNTRQFLQELPANNALLWGPRGTGKSSLIKALINTYHGEGLRLIEIQRDDMLLLPNICDPLYKKHGRFILFCDDLSFEENDPSYKAIKVVLDGSIKSTPENVLVYATSNRRHLVPEKMSENLESSIVDGELHYGDTVEEKLSLSERFGLQISFHPFNQEQYLKIVQYWLGTLMLKDEYNKQESNKAALQWALQHGSRSGRSAYLFSRDWAGKTGLRGK